MQRDQQQLEAEALQREMRSADFVDFLRLAQGIKTLTPESTRLPNLKVETLNIDKTGNTTQPANKHKWFINTQTGERVAYLGPDLGETRKDTGGAKVSAATQKELSELLLTQGFVEELRKGMASRTNQATVQAADVLDALSGGLTGFDFDKAMTFLAADPNAIKSFNELLAEGSRRLAEGEDLGTVVRDLTQKRLDQPFGEGRVKPNPPAGLTPGR